jgi:glycyl-tRNA synthetase beta chain
VAGGPDRQLRRRFLEVPQEALISTMQDNQKYFPLVDDSGRMLPRFIVISNIHSRYPEAVRSGNERVLRPRFADAEFFWEQDRRETLASREPWLATVVFERRLGTLADKSHRLARLMDTLAKPMGLDPELARRAALLAKCDLGSRMVFEFPELQGTMGRYYALHDGEPEPLAQALEQHYWPRQAGAALPEGPLAQALALADRLDTLVGIFAIGKDPSGAKDPFALRRAALGLLRILVERELPLALTPLLNAAAAAVAERVPKPWRPSRGYAPTSSNACAATCSTRAWRRRSSRRGGGGPGRTAGLRPSRPRSTTVP